jgi:UPF0716 protein FxsA
MRQLRLLLKLIERDFLFKVILALLIYSLVPLAEIIFFIYLGNMIGNWLVLVAAALVGLPGVLIAQGQLEEILERLRVKLSERRYPGQDISDLLALLVGMVLLVTPGFLTDVVGYILLVPSVRSELARALAKRMNRGLKDIYDYLRLNELEHG